MSIEAMKQALEALEEAEAGHAAQILREALAESKPKYTTTRNAWTGKATHKCSVCGRDDFRSEHAAAFHKCQAIKQAEQYNATSDHCLMENAQGDLERIKLVQTGVGIGKAEQAQPVAWYDPEVMDEDRGISWTPGQFHTAPLYTVLPWQKQQGMTAEIERLKDALNKSESRLHEVAVHCEQVERDRDAALLALRQAEKQELVAELTDDEIHDAAYATFCRGPNTRELFRMMWTCNPPCSIGWDRNELKAFARHIASLYTSPPPRQPFSDEQYEEIVEDLAEWSRYVEMDTAHQSLEKHVRQVLAAHGIKENT